MYERRLAILALILAVAIVAALPVYAAKAKTPAQVIDPKAASLLREMNEYLMGLESFSVHVDTSRDVVSPSAQTFTSDHSFDLFVQRPDRFRINMTSAAGPAQVFYDGQNVTVYTPGRNFYATMPAASTIRATLPLIAKRGIEMPLATLLQRTTNEPLTANVQSGVLVGTSMVEGVSTHHLAFRGKNVDWQIWIQNNPATPLPQKVVIIDRRVQGKPRYTAYLSSWKLDPTFSENLFVFTPPAGAQKIRFSQLPRRPGGAVVKPAARK